LPAPGQPEDMTEVGGLVGELQKEIKARKLPNSKLQFTRRDDSFFVKRKGR